VSGAWGSGSTTRWRKIRKRVLERDGWRCQLRLPPACDCTLPDCKRFHGCKIKADCVHHLDGKAAGDDPNRCVAACTPCNLQIGDPQRTQPDPPIAPRTAW
jgi:hypothetical protein